MQFKLQFFLPENIANELLLHFNAHEDKRYPNSLNKGGYSPNISEEGAKQPPPPPNIFMSNVTELNDPFRTCKEPTAKCEIKSNHLENLLQY